MFLVIPGTVDNYKSLHRTTGQPRLLAYPQSYSGRLN